MGPQTEVQDQEYQTYGREDTIEHGLMKDGPPKKSRFNAKTCACVCFLILILIGITIGVLFALFKPPTVDNFQINSLGSNPVNLDQDTGTVNVKADFLVSAELTSKSSFSYRLDRVLIETFIDPEGQSSGGQKIGTGDLANGLDIPADKVIDIEIPTAVEFQGGIQDPTVSQLISSCVLNKNNGDIPIRYIVKVDFLGIFKGIQVREDTIDLPCSQFVSAGLSDLQTLLEQSPSQIVNTIIDRINE